MKARTYPNLGELRDRLLRFSRRFAAVQSGIDEARLAAIESGREQPTYFELDSLARLYGLRAETLEEEPIRIDSSDGVSCIALSPEYERTPDVTRSRVTAVARALSDRVDLLRSVPRDAWAEAWERRPKLKSPRGDKLAWEQGRELARAFRAWAGVDGPITSVRDLVEAALPHVALFYAKLGRTNPNIAGLTFADPSRGLAVVLNLEGRNENPAFRRFSLLHEICHALVDWSRTEPVGLLSEYLDDAQLEREQRANAFAVRVLCSEDELGSLARLDPSEAARKLVGDYGMHYSAARLYLRNVANVELPREPTEELLDLTTSRWHEAERPRGLDGFPIEGVPVERRTHVARLAASAYSSGHISRDRFADYLSVPISASVERVLDYFALSQPDC